MDGQAFGIVPCTTPIDVTAKGFSKLELTSDQQMQVGVLLQHLPSVVAADAMTQFYTVDFPTGISGKLMELKRGGPRSLVITTELLERPRSNPLLLKPWPWDVLLQCLLHRVSISSSKSMTK